MVFFSSFDSVHPPSSSGSKQRQTKVPSREVTKREYLERERGRERMKVGVKHSQTNTKVLIKEVILKG
jgi:hypothetical protein